MIEKFLLSNGDDKNNYPFFNNNNKNMLNEV